MTEEEILKNIIQYTNTLEELQKALRFKAKMKHQVNEINDLVDDIQRVQNLIIEEGKKLRNLNLKNLELLTSY